MSDNHGFIVGLARSLRPPPAALLDFGCGAGEVVQAALDAGFDAWGTDTYAGGWQQYAEAGRAVLGSRLRPGDPAAPYALPFADAQFDLVVSNQVFEHVPDLPCAARALHRVMKPGAALVAIFPTREVTIEPHLKTLPWLHRLPPGSAVQRAGLRLSHRLGMASAPALTPAAFAEAAIASLHADMHYLPARAVPAALAPWFSLAARREPEFLRHRVARALPRLSPALAVLPDALLRFLCLRLASGVFVFRRAA